jgi:hypothetical protein
VADLVLSAKAVLEAKDRTTDHQKVDLDAEAPLLKEKDFQTDHLEMTARTALQDVQKVLAILLDQEEQEKVKYFS